MLTSQRGSYLRGKRKTNIISIGTIVLLTGAMSSHVGRLLIHYQSKIEILVYKYFHIQSICFNFVSFYIHCPGWQSISPTNQPRNVCSAHILSLPFAQLWEASSHAGSKANSTAGEGQPSTKSLQWNIWYPEMPSAWLWSYFWSIW